MTNLFYFICGVGFGAGLAFLISIYQDTIPEPTESQKVVSRYNNNLHTFITKATPEEKQIVYMDVAIKSTEDQRKLMDK